MRVIYAAAVLAAAWATPALAQFNGGNVAVVGGFDSAEFAGVSGTGVMYGIGAGWDFRTGGGALGVQLEAADATTKDCSLGVCVRAGRDLYAGLRGGGVLNNRTLLYLLAGYSNARVTVDGFGGTNLDGIRGGVGLEHQPGNNWFFRFEGRYTNYEQGFERWQGVAGIGIRF
ncbi:MAG TPA: outer membrane beta-barrel protein [Allosphingosinicella sp.]|nr:outer membrane beta-barrel protein [Allosphingosinicella sp.]